MTVFGTILDMNGILLDEVIMGLITVNFLDLEGFFLNLS